MRIVFGLVLMIGLALAGGAVYMVKNYIDGYQAALAAEQAERPPAVPLTELFVATRQLKYGERLAEADVRAVKWPKEAVPEGAFLAEEAALFADDGPRVVLRTMEKHEPILAVKVTEPGEPAGLTTRLAPGMRAFAIKVDVASGVSGFLRPGDRVDVYWTGRVDRGEVTKLIESGVELVAVDQKADGSDLAGTTIARTVTVAASPQQVAALAQAQSTGRLSLSLVGANDDTVAEAVQVDQMRLLGISPEPEAPKAAPEEEECTIRTRRGSEVVTIEIPCTN
ncbi:Flp pilus assembly protein CpaB [Rhodosalinus halophilus]|uniref:Flp pilus assembly protein CpaB n=1 Tax=Rhodosalinus halophilus TaxID=2259333 RepID=A0A365UBG8_9RHOB|nr:Flp pilus assembly protein CpaB [Rhodosalinus halophilus]RBI86586.1 Flp pilus assembly protein CpaB [Rhodosalinus halophilus]